MLLLLSAVTAFAVDVLTKWLALSFLPPEGVGSSFLRLLPGKNHGLSWGVPLEDWWPAALASGAFLLAIAIFFANREEWQRHPGKAVGWGLLFGGGAGNLLERALGLGVTDFIAVGSFPVFNLADAFLTAGVILLLFGERDGLLNFARWYLPPLGWALGIFFLSSIPSLETPLTGTAGLLLRKGGHAVVFAVFFLLTRRSLQHFLREKESASATPPALLLTLLFAAGDEWHQSLVPGRVGTPLDVGIDFLGAVLVITFLPGAPPAPAKKTKGEILAADLADLLSEQQQKEKLRDSL